MTTLDKNIQAAIVSQDQLVFTYHKPGDKRGTIRFVTPLRLEEGGKLLTIQHLPKSGTRRFWLNQIEDFHRVIDRRVTNPLTIDEAAANAVDA